MLRTGLRLGIILFCIFHMIAVATYDIPDEEKHEPWKSILSWSYRNAKPYLLSTSQWQKWNIFAPDPIRRVSFYSIEINKEGHWETLFEVNRDTLGWRKLQKELKLMRRIEDGGESHGDTYLHYYCKTGYAPVGAELRLRIYYFVIPTGKELAKMKDPWKNLDRTTTDNILATYYCPLIE